MDGTFGNEDKDIFTGVFNKYVNKNRGFLVSKNICRNFLSPLNFIQSVFNCFVFVFIVEAESLSSKPQLEVRKRAKVTGFYKGIVSIWVHSVLNFLKATTDVCALALSSWKSRFLLVQIGSFCYSLY